MISLKRLMQNESAVQFVKFISIGLSSTLIDLAIFSLFYYKLHFPFFKPHTPLLIAKTISFVCAVSNGFYWNSKWTFKGLGSGKLHELYLKFVSVNIVGLLINMAIIAITSFIIVHRFPSETYQLPPAVFLICFTVATGGTFFWNFTANKLWTFKKPEPLVEAKE